MTDLSVSKISSVALILSFPFNTGLLFAQIAAFYPPDASSKGVSKTVIGFISGSCELSIFIFGPIVPRYLGLLNYKYSHLTGSFLYIFGYMMFGVTTFIDNKGLYIVLALTLRILIGLGSCVSYATLFAILFPIYPRYKGSLASAVPLVTELGNLIGPILGISLFSIGGFFLPFAAIAGFSFTCLIFSCIFLPPHRSQGNGQDTSDQQKTFEGLVTSNPEQNTDGQNTSVPDKSVKNEGKRLLLKEIGKPKLQNFIKKPEIMLASIAFAILSLTQGLFPVFLVPYLIKTLDVKDDLVGLYFTPTAIVALIASPVFGCLVNWKLKWFSFILSSLVGLVASGLLSCVYFIDSFRSNAIVIPTLLSFGFCSSVGFVSAMVVLDELFQLNRGDCLEDEVRVLMSTWTQNSCYFFGRCIGATLVGGLIFDNLGYEGVLFTCAFLYFFSAVLTYLCYILTTKKSKTENKPDAKFLPGHLVVDEQLCEI